MTRIIDSIFNSSSKHRLRTARSHMLVLALCITHRLHFCLAHFCCRVSCRLFRAALCKGGRPEEGLGGYSTIDPSSATWYAAAGIRPYFDARTTQRMKVRQPNRRPNRMPLLVGEPGEQFVAASTRIKRHAPTRWNTQRISGGLVSSCSGRLRSLLNLFL